MLAALAAMVPASALDSKLGSGLGETPIWVRHPAISPDGSTLSFTYRGKIYLVDAVGGLAVPVTGQGAYSHDSVWSPDSKRLAFASDINGDDDVYIADFSGTLERLTWSSTAEVPTSFSPDGRSILYTSVRLGDAEQSVQAALSTLPQLYAVNTRSGRETLVLPNMATQASWNRDHTRLVYTYNPSNDPEDRQHRVAANARQIWTYDKASGRHEPVFPIDGIDRHNPVWSADGLSIYYLSEELDWMNVWRVELASGAVTRLTRFETDPVRDLSVADDGTLAFAWRGRIYTKHPGDLAARPIPVLTLEQHAPRHDNFYANTNQGFQSSPDGKRFAIIANADVFLQDTSGNFRQVASTPGQEKDLAFSPDGTMLAYAAMRDHRWGIYGINLAGGDDDQGLEPSYKEIRLYVPEQGNAYQPEFSPDGKKLAFVADRREVQVVDLDTGALSVLFGPDDYNSVYRDGDMEFSWSPGSQELLVQWRSMGGSEQRRVAIVPADGSAPPRPIGNIPNLLSGFWGLDGTQILGFTTLYSGRSAQLQAQGVDLYRIFLSDDARQDFLEYVDGTGLGFEVDENGLATVPRYEVGGFRASQLEERLTEDRPDPSLVAPLDVTTLISVTGTGNDSYEIATISLVDGSATRVGSFSAPDLQALSFLPDQGFVDAKIPGAILRISIKGTIAIETIGSALQFSRDPAAARAAAFEQAWADVEYRYYDSNHEGRDWTAIGKKYRAYLGSIATDRELRELISAMHGELSGSHLFTAYHGAEAQRMDLGSDNDALGVYLDYGYDGPGRRVAAILPGGPLDRRAIDLAPGDIIRSINGNPVPDAGGLDRLLDLNVGRPAQLGVVDSETGELRYYSIKPINQSDELALSRKRLLEARREMVEQLSMGCVAYQYLPSMDTPSYLDLLGNLSAQRGIAKAALIDVRSNSGGNLTRELITLLSGEAYSSLGRADGPQDFEPNNRWIWPSAVLVDSFGYSDGSIFPQAYQDSGLGKLVGDTVLNTGTAVDYVQSMVVPGLTYGIPVLPNRRLDGTYYENNVISPDIAVPFDPNRVGLNTDPQLEAAVAALMADIGEDSDCTI